MKRSPGVTAAGVVALLGSGYQAFLVVARLLISMLFVSRSGAQPALPLRGAMPMTVAGVAGSLFDLGLAAWGIATAIGLFRLEPWSRISILVFSGSLVVTATFALVPFLIVAVPQAANARVEYIFLQALLLIGVGIWWLAFFTRKGVVAQFSGTPKGS